jgi:hypothetical protein
VVLDYKDMSIEHIIVDGSNIATEGRSQPSLAQLEEAVTELRRDHPHAEITVIVDATFAHRIDPSEVPRFEKAELRGEYVHPPAGAIGRGDAFLLRVAEKVDGTVLSNDSFQEFHGEHPWLFDRGRLLGATPVPGIGWIFSPRQPVRGPRSHQAVRETAQAKKLVTKAIAVATKEVVTPAGRSPGSGSAGGRSPRRRSDGGAEPERAAAGTQDGGKPTPLAVNDPLAFISFIAEHRLGEQVEGEVESYTSHGAVIRVGEMRCYVPLANLGDPAPRSAREVLKRHQRADFVLTALDPQRRGAELALPGIAYVSGHPREETVAAEVRLARPPRKRADGLVAEAVEPAKKGVGPAKKPVEARRQATTRSRPVKKAQQEGTGGKKIAAKKATVPETTERAPARRAAVKKVSVATPTARNVTSRAPAGKLATEKAVPKKATTKKVVASNLVPKKAAAKVLAPSAAVPKNAAAKKAAPSAAVPKKAAAKKVAPSRAVPRKVTTDKVPANKAPSTRRAAPTTEREKAPRARKAPGARQAVSLPPNAARRTSMREPVVDEPRATPRARRSPRTQERAR